MVKNFWKAIEFLVENIFFLGKNSCVMKKFMIDGFKFIKLNFFYEIKKNYLWRRLKNYLECDFLWNSLKSLNIY